MVKNTHERFPTPDENPRDVNPDPQWLELMRSIREGRLLTAVERIADVVAPRRGAE